MEYLWTVEAALQAWRLYQFISQSAEGGQPGPQAQAQVWSPATAERYAPNRVAHGDCASDFVGIHFPQPRVCIARQVCPEVCFSCAKASACEICSCE